MNKTVLSILKVIGAIITVSIGAQITVDIGPIPVTGQTLAILIWAFYLNVKESFFAMLFYLVLGFIGLPIFADGASGIEKLTGGSGGFLIGFVVASSIVSYLKAKSSVISLSKIIGLTTLGTLIILIFGVGRLSMLYGFEKGLEYGFFPFWQGAILKILIGAIVVFGINRLLKSNDN